MCSRSLPKLNQLFASSYFTDVLDFIKIYSLILLLLLAK